MDADLISLDGVTTYSEADELLQDPQVDVALIALPTCLHKEFALKALAAGKHVICEKPLALNPEEGKAIVKAVEDSDRLFFAAHCIRFWPAYVAAREIVAEKRYGGVTRAHFTRVGSKPGWSWERWLMDEKRSGGCILDLHIHDVDFVNQLFGAPVAIQAQGVQSGEEGIGDVIATYTYDDGKIVTIEGSWNQHPDFPFRMAFRIACEDATLEFDTRTDGNLHVYPAEGGEVIPEISTDDGYAGEHRYFFECIAAGRRPKEVTAQSSLDTLELVEREKAMCLS